MEIRKDQYEHLIGKFGKADVLGVVPWEMIESGEFDNERTAGECIVYHDERTGNSWSGKIKIRDNDDKLEQLSVILHEAAHSITSAHHDRRFASVCWGLMLRARLLPTTREWDSWTRTRQYDIQDDPAGASWARAKAEQLAHSGAIVFRVRLFLLGFPANKLLEFSAVTAGILCTFGWVLASHFH